MAQHTFKVTMVETGEDGKKRTIEQTAHCKTRQQVIDFYGLNEADIISYRIQQID